MAQVQLGKAWQGKATVTLPHTTADDAWSLLSTFSAIHRWLPSLQTCCLIAGTDGQPGCVRYCASAPADVDGKPLLWANEELLHVDAGGRSYRYRVGDNNMGLERYEATLSAVALPDGEGGAGCQLEWRFESDPVQGWTEEGFVAYLQGGVAAMAERVEEASRAPPPPGIQKCDAVVDAANCTLD